MFAWILDKRNRKQSRITFYGVVGVEKFKKNDKIKWHGLTFFVLHFCDLNRETMYIALLSKVQLGRCLTSIIELVQPEAVMLRCSLINVFLKISQNSQGNTCARVSFLITLQVLPLQHYLKKRLWHRCFPVSFANFLRTPFLIEHLWWLLLFSENS